jgi:hypothetical protein
VTAEHAWPKWVAKYLPAERMVHSRVFESREGELSIQNRGQRDPFTTEVNCVGKACNEGWMHELEMSAEPILAPLIEGKAQV